MITAKYSFSWAESVVNKLRKAYPRATEDVMRILDITARNMAAFLAVGDPVFVDIRNLVHFLDNAGNPLSEHYTDDKLIVVIKMNWRSKSGIRIQERLDKQLKLFDS